MDRCSWDRLAVAGLCLAVVLWMSGCSPSPSSEGPARPPAPTNEPKDSSPSPKPPKPDPG